MTETLREAIEALPRYAMAQYATDEPYPNEDGWIVNRADVLAVIARSESPSPEGLDVARLRGAIDSLAHGRCCWDAEQDASDLAAEYARLARSESLDFKQAERGVFYERAKNGITTSESRD